LGEVLKLCSRLRNHDNIPETISGFHVLMFFAVNGIGLSEESHTWMRIKKTGRRYQRYIHIKSSDRSPRE
jgi:hypothetical protein